MISFSRQQYLDELATGKASRPARGINPESEDAVQASFFEWVDTYEERFPELKLFHSIPNAGGFRSKMVRWILKLTGLHAGVPDTNLPVAKRDYRGDGYNGLWIEFKSKTGTVSPEQKVWIERLRSAGHRVEVCRSWIDAANVTIEYLDLPIKRL